jgi:hypothetical protein
MIDALFEVAGGSDVKRREAAAVDAAAAVAAEAVQVVAPDDTEVELVSLEQQSVFMLLNSNSKSNTNSSNDNTAATNITDIQSQRIIDLESALQAERDAHLHMTRQYWHLKNETEREAFERATQSVPSTPRVIETPRDVSRDVEKEEQLQQLQQARAESLHFKSECVEIGQSPLLQSKIVTSGAGTRSSWRAMLFWART